MTWFTGHGGALPARSKHQRSARLLLPDGTPVPPGPGVYLLHLIDPATGRSARYGHAGHYSGVAEKDLESRIRVELAGTAQAANLLRVAYAAGLAAELVQVWPGEGRQFERRLKNRGSAARSCRRCRAEHPATRGTQPQHHHPHRTPAAPAPVTAFLRLNPAFARPARAPAAVQYARVRGREESAVLTPRVRAALEDDNHPFSQNRAAVVIGRARAARRQAWRQHTDRRAQQRAEQHRPARLAHRTHQHLHAADGRRGGRPGAPAPHRARSLAMHPAKPTPPLEVSA